MAIRTYDLLLDSYNSTIPEPIVGRQGDKNGAVTLHVTITDRGTVVDLTGQTINLIAETAKGTAVVADNLGVTLTDAANGKFDYAVPNALWSEAGKIKKAYFSLNDASGQQTTYDLIFMVKAAVDITQNKADDYITIIDGTLRDLKTKIDAIYAEYQNGSFYSRSEIDTLLGNYYTKDEIDKKNEQVYFNVKNYGAKGDESTDDSTAINEAIEAASGVKGRVWVPAGTYYLGNDLIFKSNIVFEMDKNTDIHGPGKLFRFDTYSKGYDGGVSNVTVKGGRFSGDFAGAGPFSGALHHAKNIKFIDVDFYMCVSNSHALDLGGCSNIIVDNCNFEGMLVVAGREYVEAVQTDYSYADGLTYKGDTQVDNVDGLPTINVTVKGCGFLPIYDGSAIKYPAPNPIGNHASLSSGKPSDISFYNNEIVDAPANEGVILNEGWIHFLGVTNLFINNNYFKNTNSTKSRAVMLASTDTNLPDYDTGNATQTIQDYHDGIDITDNTFDGFDGGSDTIAALGNANTGSGSIVINDNTFKNGQSFDWGNTASTGGTCIVSYNFLYSKILGNKANDCNRFIYRNDAAISNFNPTLAALNNTITRVPGFPIVIAIPTGEDSDFNVSNNVFQETRGAVYVSAVDGHVVSGNNYVKLHPTSKIPSGVNYSDTVIELNTRFGSVANNTIAQGSSTYTVAIKLHAAPINWEGNTFNGAKLVNMGFQSAPEGIQETIDNTSSGTNLNNYNGVSGFYPLKGGKTAWSNGPDPVKDVSVWGFMKLANINGVVFQELWLSNNTCYRRTQSGSPASWGVWRTILG